MIAIEEIQNNSTYVLNEPGLRFQPVVSTPTSYGPQLNKIHPSLTTADVENLITETRGNLRKTLDDARDRIHNLIMGLIRDIENGK